MIENLLLTAHVVAAIALLWMLRTFGASRRDQLLFICISAAWVGFVAITPVLATMIAVAVALPVVVWDWLETR